MCLPVNCLKKTLGLFAFIILLIGLLGIGFASYNLYRGGDVWSSDIVNWGNTLSGLLLGMGLLTTITGIFGAYGGCKQNKCCLCLYQILLLLLLVLFLALSVGASYLQDNYLSQMSEQLDNSNDGCTSKNLPQDLEWVGSINSNVVQMAAIFGNTTFCQALVNNQDAELNSYIKNLKNTSPDTGVTKAQECSGFSDDSTYSKYFDVMTFMETNFQCSGMCDTIGYYMFTDINNTPTTPLNACYKQFYEFFKNYGKLILIISWISFCFVLMNVVFTFCLCCQRKNQGGGGVYYRMSYLDDKD